MRTPRSTPRPLLLTLLIVAAAVLPACAGRIGNVDHYVSPDEFKLTLDAYNGGDPNARDSAGRTPLMLSLVTCFHDVSKKIADAGADVNAKDNAGNTTLAYLFFGRDREHKCPDDLRMLALLQAHGLKIEDEVSPGVPTLVAALTSDTSGMFDALVAAGANVNAKTGNGRTLLHVASFRADATLVQRLAAAGVDANAQDEEGNTALHLAAVRGHGDTMRALLAAKADPNAATKAGETPLHIVAGGNQTALVEQLLAAGANPSAVRTEGSDTLTPLDDAIAYSADEAAELLRGKGATATGAGDKKRAMFAVWKARAASREAFTKELNEITELDKDTKLMWWVLKRSPAEKKCRVAYFVFDIETRGGIHAHTWPTEALDDADGSYAPIAKGQATCHRHCGDIDVGAALRGHEAECGAWDSKKVEPERPLSAI